MDGLDRYLNRPALVIARRQLAGYFNGPVAYIVVALVMILLGVLFWEPFFLMQRATVQGMFDWLTTLLAFAAPALTMGLIAEEKGSGTIELLVTMPVRDRDVIAGKYLAALTLLVTLLLATLSYPICVMTLGHLDWGQVWTGYFGILLEGGAFFAIGIAASAFTDNQLVAFFVALVFTLFFTYVGWFAPFTSGWVSDAVNLLSFKTHVDSMAHGVVDTKDLVFFGSVIAAGLTLAAVAVESRRWR